MLETVVAAVEQERAALPAEFQDSPLVLAALSLARELDSRNSATSKAMCAKALNETLTQLRALVPEAPAKDGVDDIARRRQERLEGGSKPARRARS